MKDDNQKAKRGPQKAVVAANGEAIRNGVTIAELAARPAFSLTRRQFRAVSGYAQAMQDLTELRLRREHFISQAATMETDIELATLSAKECGEALFE